MCALMLASNVSVLLAILTFQSVYKVISADETLNGWHWFLAILALLFFIASDACFNIATWLLAYNYYICADKLEDVHQVRKADENMMRRERNHTILFWTVMSINIIAAILWGSFRFGRNLCIYTKCTQETMDLYNNAEFYSQVIDAIVQTTSFVFLSYGLVKIRKFLVRYSLENKINNKMIWLQAICFGSYLAINILLFIEIAVLNAESEQEAQKNAKIILIVWIISLFLNFIT